jgi:hypothetical protein
MNRNRGKISRLTLLMLIGLLLFKGVAAAAMLCCGPDHSSKHSQMPEHQMMTEHSHHSMPEHSDHQPVLNDSGNLTVDDHELSCPGCAVSCAAAVLMINPSDFIAAPPQTERIISFNSLVLPLTLSGLERPPRLFS